jgi:hypothetical protein
MAQLFAHAMNSVGWITPDWWWTWFCRPMWGAGWQCWGGF